MAEARGRIVFYTQPGCPACITAKEFLSSRGLTIEQKNIRSDPEFVREVVEDLGSRATPTVVFGDKVVVGFHPAEYDAALRSIQH